MAVAFHGVDKWKVTNTNSYCVTQTSLVLKPACTPVHLSSLKLGVWLSLHSPGFPDSIDAGLDKGQRTKLASRILITPVL